jgi:hypothetical protein
LHVTSCELLVKKENQQQVTSNKKNRELLNKKKLSLIFSSFPSPALPGSGIMGISQPYSCEAPQFLKRSVVTIME